MDDRLTNHVAEVVRSSDPVPGGPARSSWHISRGEFSNEETSMSTSDQPAIPMYGPSVRPRPMQTATKPRPRVFSHRPNGYSSAAWWLIAGITRDWRGVTASVITAWFNLPLAIAFAV